MDKYAFAILLMMCIVSWILLCFMVNGVSLLMAKRKAKQEKEARQQLEMKKRLFSTHYRLSFSLNDKMKDKQGQKLENLQL